jgi:hypothetical protein
MHTLLDLHGNIPAFIRVTSGDVHDVNILDEIMPEAGSFYVMDRAYIDFQRLFVFTLSSAFFVVRTKSLQILSVTLFEKTPNFGMVRLFPVLLFSYSSVAMSLAGGCRIAVDNDGAASWGRNNDLAASNLHGYRLLVIHVESPRHDSS